MMLCREVRGENKKTLLDNRGIARVAKPSGADRLAILPTGCNPWA